MNGFINARCCHRDPMLPNCVLRSDGKGKHECRLVFHGTKSTANIDSIMTGGFKLNKVGSATDSGYYGKDGKLHL